MNRYALRSSSAILVAVIVLGLMPGVALAAAPVASPDSVSTNEDTSKTITLAGTDIDGDALAFTITAPPSHGGLGSITTPVCSGIPSACTAQVQYTPTSNYHGPDSLTFKVDDGSIGGTDTASVAITVVSVNDSPTAVNDPTNPINGDVTTTLDPLSNDSDPDGDSLTITGTSGVSLGVVTIINAGTKLSYNPTANVSGTDSFTYTISDGHGGTGTATITVQISAVNHAPNAVNDPTNPIVEDITTTLNPLANDSDPDSDPLTITGTAGVTLGVVSITSGGTRLSYNPNANVSGTDSFTYTISDGRGGTGTATVTVQISAVNDAPDAVNDLNIPITRDASATPIPVLANDTDVEGDTLTITGKTNGAKGTVAITGSGSGLTYDPGPGYIGSDSFTYTISDGHGGSDTATVTVFISGDNRLPNAVNDIHFSVPEGAGAMSLAVLDNDDDPDGDTLHIIARTVPAHGTVTITGGGAGLTYDPVSLYYGLDSFKYTISDGKGGTDTATVVVTVTRDTAAPIAVAPVQRLLGQTVGTSTLKARIAWTASDAGSGIRSYQVQVSVNGHAYTTIALPSPTRAYTDQVLKDYVSYRYRVRATDREGNVSGWRYSATFKPAVFQETTGLATYGGSWASRKSTAALGGAVRYTATLGNTVTFAYTMSDFGLVVTRTASSGSADIYVDGVLASRVNLRATATIYRQLVFARHFATLAVHTIEIRPIGTGRVDIDAFAVLH